MKQFFKRTSFKLSIVLNVLFFIGIFAGFLIASFIR